MKESKTKKVQKFRVENTTLMQELKNLRIELGYSTSQIANKHLMSQSSYNGYETGQTKNITPETLEKFFFLAYEKNYKSKYENENKSYDDFILMKIRNQFDKYSKEYLSKQLWMFYLSLMHTYVNINTVIMKKLEDLYETDVWAVIFKSLNLNPTIKRKYLYPEKNVIYIDELTDSEKEQGKIPIFRIIYELSSEQINAKQDLAFDNGKISVVDLFMLIFNKEIKKYDDEQEAFISSCKTIHLMGADFIYNQVGLFPIPQSHSILVSKDTIKLMVDLQAFLNERKDKQDTEIMKIFCSNISNLGFDFVNTISVNFNFINKLTVELKHDLKTQLAEFVRRFQEEHLSDKYLN